MMDAYDAFHPRHGLRCRRPSEELSVMSFIGTPVRSVPSPTYKSCTVRLCRLNRLYYEYIIFRDHV